MGPWKNTVNSGSAASPLERRERDLQDAGKQPNLFPGSDRISLKP